MGDVMKGTEKQIDYAKIIIGRIEKIILNATNHCPEELTKHFMEMNDKIIANLNNAYAGDVISGFKDLRITDDWQYDYEMFMIDIQVEKSRGLDYKK